MNKLLPIFISLLFILMPSFLLSQHQVYAANSTTTKIKVNAKCTVELFFADQDGKAVPTNTKPDPAKTYQVKARYPNDVKCSDISTIELGDYVEDKGGQSTSVPKKCFKLKDLVFEGNYQIAYYNFTVPSGSNGASYALIGVYSGQNFTCEAKAGDLKSLGYAWDTIRFGSATPTSGGNTGTTPSTTPPANTPAHTPSSQNYYKYGNVDFDAKSADLKNLISIDSVPQFLVRLAKIIFILLGSVATIVILVGAFRMAMSQGNSDAVTTAKRTVTWAIIGLVVAILSYSIVAILQSFIGVN